MVNFTGSCRGCREQFIGTGYEVSSGVQELFDATSLSLTSLTVLCPSFPSCVTPRCVPALTEYEKCQFRNVIKEQSACQKLPHFHACAIGNLSAHKKRHPSRYATGGAYRVEEFTSGKQGNVPVTNARGQPALAGISLGVLFRGALSVL